MLEFIGFMYVLGLGLSVVALIVVMLWSWLSR